MAETIKKPDPAHDEELDQAAEARFREVLDQYVNELGALAEAHQKHLLTVQDAAVQDAAVQDAPDPEAEAQRSKALRRAAEKLRTAEGERDREEARDQIRELGEVPGDFVLQLVDGSQHRVEVPSTHHNGQKVAAIHEDVQ